jgi:hypothetical protein
VCLGAKLRHYSISCGLTLCLNHTKTKHSYKSLNAKLHVEVFELYILLYIMSHKNSSTHTWLVTCARVQQQQAVPPPRRTAPIAWLTLAHGATQG